MRVKGEPIRLARWLPCVLFAGRNAPGIGRLRIEWRSVGRPGRAVAVLPRRTAARPSALREWHGSVDERHRVGHRGRSRRRRHAGVQCGKFHCRGRSCVHRIRPVAVRAPGSPGIGGFTPGRDALRREPPTAEHLRDAGRSVRPSTALHLPNGRPPRSGRATGPRPRNDVHGPKQECGRRGPSRRQCSALPSISTRNAVMHPLSGGTEPAAPGIVARASVGGSR